MLTPHPALPSTPLNGEVRGGGRDEAQRVRKGSLFLIALNTVRRFSTSPWRSTTLSAHYRWFDDESHYMTNQVPQPVGGYPGLIRWRDLLSHEVEAKLVVRPVWWLKGTLSYQFLTSDYEQSTRPAFDVLPPVVYSPGGQLQAGEFDSHIYSVGAVLTPWRRLVLSTTLSYQDTITTTASAGFVPPYKGNIYSVLASGTYLLNEKTDLTVNYAVSLADYAQPSPGPGSPPPLGLEYQQHAVRTGLVRRLTKNLTTKLEYGFYYYDEPSNAGVNNYRAHSIFGTVAYHWR